MHVAAHHRGIDLDRLSPIIEFVPSDLALSTNLEASSSHRRPHCSGRRSLLKLPGETESKSPCLNSCSTYPVILGSTNRPKEPLHLIGGALQPDQLRLIVLKEPRKNRDRGRPSHTTLAHDQGAHGAVHRETIDFSCRRLLAFILLLLASRRSVLRSYNEQRSGSTSRCAIGTMSAD